MAQDLSSLTIALVDGKKIEHIQQSKILPEKYVFTIEATLKQWEVKIDQISGVRVVVGPGSFTSCRVVTTIANAFAFARSIPIQSIENPNGLSLESLIDSTVAVASEMPFVLPSYSRSANIKREAV